MAKVFANVTDLNFSKPKREPASSGHFSRDLSSSTTTVLGVQAIKLLGELMLDFDLSTLKLTLLGVWRKAQLF